MLAEKHILFFFSSLQSIMGFPLSSNFFHCHSGFLAAALVGRSLDGTGHRGQDGKWESNGCWRGVEEVVELSQASAGLLGVTE